MTEATKNTEVEVDPVEQQLREDAIPEEAPKKRPTRKSQAQLNEWGPYDDYVFVTTPHGEYAVPAGQTLSFKMVGGVPYPQYEGKYLTFSDAEMAERRAERAKTSQAGKG